MEKQIGSSVTYTWNLSGILHPIFSLPLKLTKLNNMNNSIYIYNSRSLSLTFQKLKNSSCLIFITTQWGKYIYCQFTDKKN